MRLTENPAQGFAEATPIWHTVSVVGEAAGAPGQGARIRIRVARL
jgi:hypothetical protein